MSADAGMRVETGEVAHSAVCEEVCNRNKLWCERWSRGMHRTCETYVAWMTNDGSETLRIGDDVSHIQRS